MKRHAAYGLIGGLFVGLSALGPGAASAKTVLKSQNNLPRFSYPVSGAAQAARGRQVGAGHTLHHGSRQP
jgi:hypothetical protein